MAKYGNKFTNFSVKVFQCLIYWPTFLILKFFIHYKIVGQENLKEIEGKPVIFAANHVSYIDGPVSAASLPRYGRFYPKKFFPIRFLVLSKYFSWRYLFVAMYVRLNGSVPVYKRTGNDLDVVLADAVRALNSGANLWIYPEGRISKNGQLRPGRRGVAYLHQATGVPIVPVAIKGLSGILPWRFLLRKRRVTVVIGEPIYSLGDVSYEDGAAKVMSAIEKLLHKKI